MKYIKITNLSGEPEYCLGLNGSSLDIQSISDVPKKDILDKVLDTCIVITNKKSTRVYLMWSGYFTIPTYIYTSKLVTNVKGVAVLDVTDFRHLTNKPKECSEVSTIDFKGWSILLNSLTPEEVRDLSYLMDKSSEVRHSYLKELSIPKSVFMIVGLYRWEHFKQVIESMPNYVKEDFIKKLKTEGYGSAMCNEYSKKVFVDLVEELLPQSALNSVEETSKAIEVLMKRTPIDTFYDLWNKRVKTAYTATLPMWVTVGEQFYVYNFTSSNHSVSKVTLREERYIEYEEGDSIPIEDVGDAYFSKELIDVEEAFVRFNKEIEERYAEAYHNYKTIK